MSVLGSMDSYLAVIDPVCGILYEDTEKDPGEEEEGDIHYFDDEAVAL